jgi:hypothetical protein
MEKLRRLILDGMKNVDGYITVTALAEGIKKISSFTVDEVKTEINRMVLDGILDTFYARSEADLAIRQLSKNKQKVYIRDYLVSRNGAVYISNIPPNHTSEQFKNRKYLWKNNTWHDTCCTRDLMDSDSKNYTDYPGIWTSLDEAIKFAKSKGYDPVDLTDSIIQSQVI